MLLPHLLPKNPEMTGSVRDTGLGTDWDRDEGRDTQEQNKD